MKQHSYTADEGRALHNLGLQQHRGASAEARGLNCFSPNVNLLRAPTYGRNLEILSEDPFMLGELGVQYAMGLQVGADFNLDGRAAGGF